MSNVFKSNSRFAGLIDEPEYDKKSTSVKLMKKMGWKEGSGMGKNQDGIKTTLQVEKREHNIGLGFNSFNSFKDSGFRERRQNNRHLSEREIQKIREEYKVEDEAKKKFEKQEEERRIQESLTMDNFPDLVLQNNEHKQTFEESYIEKLKTIHEVESTSNDPDLEKLKDGWIIIKKDVSTGKIITKGTMMAPRQVQLTEHELTQNIIDELGELHERRTQEYIDLNGYDKWENMFKCKNWREWEAHYEIDTDDEDDNSDDDDDIECYDEY